MCFNIWSLLSNCFHLKLYTNVQCRIYKNIKVKNEQNKKAPNLDLYIYSQFWQLGSSRFQ